MTDQYGTTDRPTLDMQLLAQRLHDAGFVGEMPRYSRVTSSTQDDARALYEIGKRPPYSAVTDEQTAGRGRLSRSWDAPPCSSILLTIALPKPADLVAFPLLVGVAVLNALRPTAPQLGLKWPNDIVTVVDGEVRKLGGLIAEVHGDAVFVGIGLNVDLHEAELPTPQALSLRQLGIRAEREALIAGIIAQLTAQQIPTLAEYRELCLTLGAQIRVTLVDGSVIEGIATDVSPQGALRVAGMDIAAGDVQHVRSP